MKINWKKEIILFFAEIVIFATLYFLAYPWLSSSPANLLAMLIIILSTGIAAGTIMKYVFKFMR